MWQRHRDRLMGLFGSHGRRPLAWWRYDSPIPYPGYDREQSTLYEAGLIEAAERDELVAEWRSEFERAQAPGFSFTASPKSSHGTFQLLACMFRHRGSLGKVKIPEWASLRPPLCRRGVPQFRAAIAAGSPTGLWRMSGHPAVQHALRNHFFDPSAFPNSMSPPTLNLIEPPWYGPVCPVVWEGWHREVFPYPDQFALVMPAVARGVHLSESNRSPRARISFWTGIGSSSTRGMRRGRPAGRLGCAGVKTAGGGSSELSSSAAIDWAKKVAFDGIGLMVTSSISRSKSASATDRSKSSCSVSGAAAANCSAWVE